MSELNLFFSPRACSLACHIALEESGLPFTATSVKIRKGEHKQNSYKKVNPWGKIPSLAVDQEVLTETHAILSYIGDSVAATKQLLPQKNPLQRARAHEWAPVTPHQRSLAQGHRRKRGRARAGARRRRFVGTAPSIQHFILVMEQYKQLLEVVQLVFGMTEQLIGLHQKI